MTDNQNDWDILEITEAQYWKDCHFLLRETYTREVGRRVDAEDALEECKKVAAQQHRDLMKSIDTNFQLERTLHVLQQAVYEHQRYMWCHLYGTPPVDKGNYPVPTEWINHNDSGSLADALANSGWPTDEYGNLLERK